ncbi:MAG: class D beta-lactamase [Ignavibacteria bacterium]|nr:class D beta-lactamase [Ignavibacteria bacterium]
MKRYLLVLLFAVSALLGQDYKKYFDEYNVKGSFMLYDMNNEKYVYFDSARCYERFTPASTFKIPNSIIGLETGVIADENFVIPWDSIKTREVCSRDMDLKDAIKYSCVWYYRELARRVGAEKMQEMLNAFDYGNKDMSSGADIFWLEGSLKISQAEQVKFLKKLCTYELPVSKRSIDILKNIIVLDSTGSYIFRGKTGWGYDGVMNIGWLVGWVEKENNIYIYAVNIESPEEVPLFAEARRSIAEKIMKDLGILK